MEQQKALRHLDDILSRAREDREDQLRFLTDEQRNQLFLAWAEDPRLTVTDLVALPEPYRTKLTKFATGDDGGPGTNRVFIIGPNPEWKPPEKTDIPKEILEKAGREIIMEEGSRNGQMRFQKINRPQMTPIRDAIKAMLLFGESAILDLDRGKLKEFSEEEYQEWQMNKKSKDEMSKRPMK